MNQSEGRLHKEIIKRITTEKRYIIT